jgi:hypothetical protein
MTGLWEEFVTARRKAGQLMRQHMSTRNIETRFCRMFDKDEMLDRLIENMNLDEFEEIIKEYGNEKADTAET